MALAATIGAAVLLVALTVALSLFAILGGSYPKASDLAKMPEASLVYPGSKLVRTVSEDAGKFGSSNASLNQIYEVDASEATVAAYYHDKLIAIGWETRQPMAFTDDSTDYEYERGTARISLLLWAGQSGPNSTSYGLNIYQS
jgi:hypothetical protein